MRALFGRWWWLFLLAVLLLPGGAFVAVVQLKLTEEQRRIRRAAREAAKRYGIRPELVEAIGYVESRWRLSAVNKSGADGLRGGSWGPFQLSEKTARAYGYTGTMEALTKDPALAAEWCARILSKRPGGAPRTTNEAAAWWNGGRATFEALPATNSARTDYAPKLAAAESVVIGNPV